MRSLSGWARRPRQSLPDAMVAVLTVAGIIGAVSLAALLGFVIAPSFDRLEDQSVRAAMERVERRLDGFAERAEGIARDHASMAGAGLSASREALPVRLARTVYADHRIEGSAYRRAGEATWHIAWQHPDTARQQVATRAALAAILSRLDLARWTGREGSAHFYTRLGDRIAAIGVARIPDPVGRGDDASYVALVHLLTPQRLGHMIDRPARIDLRSPADRSMATWSRRSVSVSIPIRGPDGGAVATAAFTTPRELALLGRRTMLLAIAGSILLLVFMLVLLRRAISQLVLAPLGQIEQHMQRVRMSGVLMPFNARAGRDDEIGSLGRSFNAMLSQLKGLREQNEIQSFALGRSESAVAVLHNVRNALAPLGTILSHGAGRTPSADPALLDRALRELGDANVPPGRRTRLVAFVRAAIEAEALARDRVREQLEIGRDAMRQTLEIIGTQQARANERPQRERCDMAEILANNATIARYAQDVAIAIDVPTGPVPVLANRVILSQVVGNLFANAVEAIVATGREAGHIQVEVEANPVGQVVTRIVDDGEGFDPAVQARLFQPGYSMRKDKSGGLGLHWCANSMAAMGGGLELRSEGEGKGATAILILDPVRDEAIVTARAA
ncbi:ATP-binding protein [Sphingomonadaceae bacterium jetA1]|jgi:signal transduction histidine kinase|uniref:ATP-binding protein n=1 Tax=Facivitalis istanbulensis TaxID=3075838 RepID=UPI00346E7A44